MRIENGFAKFELNETVDVELIKIGYTKNNHRPYAVCDGSEGRFNVNIKDSATTLHPGRYQIKCTGVSNTGFCYVELQKLQHSSWDTHDKQVTKSIPGDSQAELNKDMLEYNIKLTLDYMHNLKVECITDGVDELFDNLNSILQVLYLCYGVTMYKLRDDNDDVLS